MSRLARRKAVNVAATAVALSAVALALFPLFSVVWEVAQRGGDVVSFEFLTGLPTGPHRAGGGIANAIWGTVLVVGIGTAIGTPVGVLAGVYLAEYGTSRFAAAVRLVADALAGVPSIVAGLFGFAVVVSTSGFSAVAGGVALAVILLPVVTRTTEEALRTVPITYREAALALGAPRWRATLQVVLPAAIGPVLTGILLGVARIAGETAPLLLTVLTSFFMVVDPTEPVATLPYLVYDYGKSAVPKYQDQAWGAALVLLGLVLTINLTVRFLARKTVARQQG